MTAFIGPIRFNGDTQAEAFRDWVREQHQVDVRDCGEDEVQDYHDEYVATGGDDHARCDAEVGRLCSKCRAEMRAEADAAYREWAREEKPLIDAERSLGMTRDEMMRDAGRVR